MAGEATAAGARLRTRRAGGPAGAQRGRSGGSLLGARVLRLADIPGAQADAVRVRTPRMAGVLVDGGGRPAAGGSCGRAGHEPRRRLWRPQPRPGPPPPGTPGPGRIIARCSKVSPVRAYSFLQDAVWPRR